MRSFARDRADFIAARQPRMKQWISQRDAAEPGSDEFLYYNDIVCSNIVMVEDLQNKYILTLPTVTFRDRLTLDLGDLRLKLYYFGEGLHTGDDILIHCPEEKLLFTGDLFYKGTLRTAIQEEFDADRWIVVLDEVLADEDTIDFAYDTHNGRMTCQHIVLSRNYLVDLYTGLKAAKEAELSFSEVEQMFAYDLKFRYLEKSGLDPAKLRQDHAASLQVMWTKVSK